MEPATPFSPDVTAATGGAATLSTLTRYHNSLLTFLKWQLEHDPLVTFVPSRFLDLRVTSTSPEGESDAELDEETASIEWGRFSVRALALLKNPNRQLLLTGISGAGKTVALGCLAYRLTSTAIAALEVGTLPDLIPLWTPAPDLPDVDFSSPVSWLAGCLQDGGIYSESGCLAEALLESDRLVLLIDSLHEVAGISAARTRTLGRLAKLPRVRIVASARPGYEFPRAEQHCDVLDLEGLNPAERSQILGSRESDPARRSQLHQLALQPRLRRAVEVPHIWQMAITLVQEGVDLANVTQEAALYDCFFDEALRARRRASPSLYLAPDVEPLVEMLGAMSAFRGGQDIPLQEATELVERWAGCDGRARQLLYPHTWPQQFLDHLPRFFHPVLRINGKQLAIGFAHGSLADFLAARWVLRMWGTVPVELLPMRQLSDLVSLATELLELRGASSATIAELDAKQVHQGSLPLLLSWLRRTPSERIEATAGALQERVWRASRKEARQILIALGFRGKAWAEHVMASLLNSLGQEQAKWFREPIEKGARRHQTSNEPFGVTGKQKHGTRKRSNATPVKDLPSILEPIPTLSELLRRLQAKDSSIRAEAARTLGLSSYLEAVDALISLLDPDREKSAEVRGRAATALGRLGNPEAVPELVTRLDPTREPDAVVRGRAARALGFLLDLRAVEPLIQCLNPLRESDDVVRGSAVSALGILGDSRALEALIGLLNPAYELDPKNRGAAAKALGNLGNPWAVEPLLLRLDPALERDGAVRGAAATALGALGDPRAVGPLILRLDPTRERDGAVRGAVATALGALGDPRAVEPLILCLDPKLEGIGAVRGAAATALGALGDPRAVGPLILGLDPARERNGAVRGAAATALGALGDLRAVEPLLLRLDPKLEPGPDVRGSAATALGLLGDLRAVDPLNKKLDPRLERDHVVRQSAASALRRLDLRGMTQSTRRPLKHSGAESSTPGAGKLPVAAARPAGQPAQDLSEQETTALQALWSDLLENFFLWTETPPESSFPRELERCLLAMERYLGGAASRGWVEKDYERVLAALLAKDRGGVVTQAEPADRERTDILAQLSDGSQVVLELKFDDPKRLAEHLSQLRQYLASFKNDDRLTTGHLILLDTSSSTSWAREQRYFEEDGIPIWRVHVNRQPASKTRNI